MAVFPLLLKSFLKKLQQPECTALYWTNSRSEYWQGLHDTIRITII